MTFTAASPTPLVLFQGKPVCVVDSPVTIHKEGEEILISSLAPRPVQKKKGLQGKIVNLNDTLDEAEVQMKHISTGLDINGEIEAMAARVRKALQQLQEDFDRQSKQTEHRMEILRNRSFVREKNDIILDKCNVKCAALFEKLAANVAIIEEEVF